MAQALSKLEIIPRLTKLAGFEWGSGFYINPVPPEDAAAFLREVEPATPAQPAPPTPPRPAAPATGSA